MEEEKTVRTALPTDPVESCRSIGEKIAHALYRVILYEDGRGEAEFDTPNPVECLVLKWENASEFASLLRRIENAPQPPEQAVIRKKCVKCLLHERDVRA